MIQIAYPDPTDPDWIEWHGRAEEESVKLRAYAEEMAREKYEGFEAPEVTDLYKGPKEWLMQAFNGKCAFCEARIDATQPGDVEHFRPKKAVEDQHGSKVRIDTPSGERDHPGYFWLAYEWSNLLIACNTCNRSGKGIHFPLEDGSAYALEPDEVAAERALFINPLKEDPSPFLRFDDTGIAIALNPRGEKCVELLDLNRDALVDERKETYDNVLLKSEKYLGIKETDPESAKLQLELDEWKNGKRKFAAQARVAIQKVTSDVTAKLKRLGL